MCVRACVYMCVRARSCSNTKELLQDYVFCVLKLLLRGSCLTVGTIDTTDYRHFQLTCCLPGMFDGAGEILVLCVYCCKIASF